MVLGSETHILTISQLSLFFSTKANSDVLYDSNSFANGSWAGWSSGSRACGSSGSWIGMLVGDLSQAIMTGLLEDFACRQC